MWDKIAKLVLKEGFKLAAPVVGNILADVGGELSGIIIDQRSKDALDAVQQRVIRRLMDQLRSANIEGIDEKQLAPLEATVTAVLGDEKAMMAAWVDSGFDASRAAERVWMSATRFQVGLSESEKTRSQSIIEAVFRALDAERKTIDATEADFRRRVLDSLDRVAALSLRSEQIDRIVEAAMLSLPVRAYHNNISPPGALLRADIDRPVPFHGRQHELQELTLWSSAEEAIAVRLMTGPGGMGKTRLIIELSRHLQSQGWTAGFLDERITIASDEPWVRLVAGANPLLVVVDYAENRRAQIGALLRAVLARLGSRHVRLVLLARAADDWWDAMRQEGAGVGDLLAGPATSRIALRALAPDPGARAESYRLAAKHFSRVLDRSITRPEPDFNHSDFERALLLHMAALASVEGVAVKGEQGLLGNALDRERRFWRHRSASLGLAPLYERAILQAMAVVTLAGGAVDRRSAVDIVTRLPVLSRETPIVVDAIVGLLHETYQGDRWIDPLLPDLLGEHLVQVSLDDGSDEILNIVFGPPSSLTPNTNPQEV